MTAALRVEWWKMRRSPVTLTATILMAVLLPLMGLGFYQVALRGGTGPLAQKASAFLVGEGWEAYLGLVDQIAAVAMLLGGGVVAAWMFGREHSDRTFPALFGLPVSRASIAVAKYLVLFVWAGVLACLVTAAAFLLGAVAEVGPLQAEVVAPGLLRLLAVAGSTCLLSLSAGLVASIGRGYLPAIAALILIVAAAQVAVLFGTGGWFPFAIPGLLAIAGTDGAPSLTAVQLALVPATVAAATWLTVRWWQRAEVA